MFVLNRFEERRGNRGERVKRSLHALPGLIGASAEALNPRINVLDVDLLFGRQAIGEVRDRFVGRSREPAKPQTIEVVAEELPANGRGPVELIRGLDDRGAAERLGRPAEGQGVG